MSDALRDESERLRRSWQRHDAAMLRDYLVADVEDPRINVQSVLTRHFLAFALTGRFQELADQEIRFALALNWLLQLRKENPGPDAPAAVLHALRHDADNAEGIELPHHLRQTFRGLPTDADGCAVPDYLTPALQADADPPGEARLPAAVLDTFLTLWRTALEPISTPACRVLEPACGSANDYRFLVASGLAARIDYTGIDLSEKNITNARALFPQTRFEVGNAFDLDAGSGNPAYDYAFVHDLFEHLSPDGLVTALRSVCRATRRGLCLHFFNMDEIPSTVVRPVEEYHWNTVSLDEVLAGCAAEGFNGQAFHIGTFLRQRFGCETTHNPNAYTLLLGRSEPGS